MTEEVWKPIPGYEGLYEVSSLGRVRSHHRGGRDLSTNGRDQTGYPVVSLTRDGKRRTYTLHRLVCTTFHGPCPDGREAAHLDGNPENARADNLAWTTKSENNQHKHAHGTAPIGEANHNAILTAESVLSILTDPRSAREVAAIHGISRHTVVGIRRGNTWKHLHADANARRG